MGRSVWIWIVLSTQTLWAGELMKNLRQDSLVPENCQNLDLKDFMKADLETFTFSALGGAKKGFTYEHPLTSKQVFQLHKDIRGRRGPSLKVANYTQAYEDAQDFQEPMDFDFDQAGNLFELLAIVEFQRESLDPEYFVTGSVKYRDPDGSGLEGELDMVIGQRRDCRVLAIGEVKMGTRRLRRATSQLKRFVRFLNWHRHPLPQLIQGEVW